ncbi:MAG: hypothetical protein BWX79_02768 [Alphaproteobacteria bacterium ADurb.Bin100]|nr:MAG: hypothetical protein BWX79_02768 [Alphaproteobacteria bacterium ADurb.Bin100]
MLKFLKQSFQWKNPAHIVTSAMWTSVISQLPRMMLAMPNMNESGAPKRSLKRLQICSVASMPKPWIIRLMAISPLPHITSSRRVV